MTERRPRERFPGSVGPHYVVGSRMSASAIRGVAHQLGLLADPPADADLLTRYARQRDGAAFAELLRRHGPVVLGVCRRMLGDAHAAEDAFQAVFLVLAKKADAVRPPGSVGGWLYGVAVRVANKARVAEARRRRREMARTASRTQTPGAYTPGSVEHRELRAVLDAELAALPDHLRAVIVACDLHGRSRSAVARDLGWPEGTVAARLAKARTLLAGRLTRRGVTLPAAGLAAVLASEPVSAGLAQTTLAAAEGFALGVASAASPTAQVLAEGVIRAMSKGTFTLVAAVLAAGLVAGGGILWGAGMSNEQPGPAAAAEPKAKLTLEAPGYVTDVSYSANGELFAVVAGGKVTVCDAATGKTRWVAPGEAARFTRTPAGRDDLIVMTDAGVGLRDAVSGTPHGRTAPRPKTKEGWHLVRFSPDGTRYAAHFGFGVRVYDTQTGAEVVRLANQYEPGSSTVAPAGKDVFFAPDGKRVVGVGVLIEPGRMGIAVWDVGTGDRVAAMAEYEAGGGPMAAAVRPDGKTLAAAYTDHIALWPEPEVAKPDADRIERGPLRRPMRFTAAGVPTALAFSPDGKTLAVGTRSAKSKPVVEVQLFDAATGTEVRRFGGFGNVLPVSALVFSLDGKQLVAGTGFPNVTPLPADAPRAGEVKVFALTPAPDPAPQPAPPIEPQQTEPQWKEKAVLTDRGKPVHAVAYSPDGKAFAVAGDGIEVQVYNAATHRVSSQFLIKESEAVHGLNFHPTEKWLAVTNLSSFCVYDPTTGENAPGFTTWAGQNTAIRFAPDGKRLAVSNGKKTRVLDLDGRGGEVSMGGPPPVEKSPDPVPAGVAWAPDGKRIAMLRHEKWEGKFGPLVWGAGSGEGMLPLAGHAEFATAVDWSKDGKVIASGGLDGLVILWDAATGKKLWESKRGGRDGTGVIHAVAISPDGKTVAAAVQHNDGKSANRVVFLDAATGRDIGFVSRPWGLPVVAVAWSPDGKFLVTACGLKPYLPRPNDIPKDAGEVVVWERAGKP